MTQDPNLPPRWDVTNVYPGLNSADYQADFELVNTKTDALFVYLDEHKIEKRTTSPDETNPQELAQQLSGACRQYGGNRRAAGTAATSQQRRRIELAGHHDRAG